MKSKVVTTNKARRLFNCIWRQKAKTPVCPMEPRIDNQIVVITGGNRGIGLETTKGLLARGAEVIILSRSPLEEASLLKYLGKRLHVIQMDLADISSIKNAIEPLKQILNTRRIDKLINNAGIARRGVPYRESPQGYELTFAVNVLGHHILFQACHSGNLLASDAQIIAITGDLYVQAAACTPNFKYKGTSGNAAYARSKLGVMWWAYTCHRRYKNYKINLVHPGAVLTGLGGGPGPLARRIMRAITLTPEEGAQMSLICATQPDIEPGGYYHNTVGHVILPAADIALHQEKAEAFWALLDKIQQAHL